MHFHNDMGMATANAFTAAECGAFQLHTTVNGIGERAGNASLEELLVALRMKGGGTDTIRHISETFQMVSVLSPPSPGPRRGGRQCVLPRERIHIAALLVDSNTYEYFPPKMVGGEQRFVLGSTPGRGPEHIARTFGCELDDSQIDRVLHDVKRGAGNAP